MSDKPLVVPADSVQVQRELQEVAGLLRQSRHLAPSVQQEVANLLEELSRAVGTMAVPSAEMLHVARNAALLAQHLHEPEPGRLESLYGRMDEALLRAEAKAPLVVGIARRLIDAAADIGI